MNALAVATLLGTLLGAVAGAGLSLYDILRWWTFQSPLPLIVATAKMGGVAGFTFALALLARFLVTRKVIGPFGGAILGGVCALIGLQAYLIAQPSICLAGGSIWGLYSMAVLGAPFGSLVGAAARSAPSHEGRVRIESGSASGAKGISPA